MYIMLTSAGYENPGKPHFIKGVVGFTGGYIIFLFRLKNIGNGYLVFAFVDSQIVALFHIGDV